MQVLQYAWTIFTEDEPIDDLVQERHNSSVLAMECLALTHHNGPSLLYFPKPYVE